MTLRKRWGLLAINLEMMKTFLLIFILSCILVFSEAKLTKKQKKIVKKFKKVRNQAFDYEETMAALNTTLEDVEKTLSASSRHIFNTDALVVVDATFTGTQCGPFTLTTWSITQNRYRCFRSFQRGHLYFPNQWLVSHLLFFKIQTRW